MRWVFLAVSLAFAGPAAADADVSIAEWQYLQRVGVVSSVNEDLWKAFEDSGGWNPQLACYTPPADR